MDNPAVHNLDDVRLRAENGQIVLEVADQTVPVDVDIDGSLSLDEIEAFTDNSIDAKGSDLENLGSVNTDEASIGNVAAVLVADTDDQQDIPHDTLTKIDYGRTASPGIEHGEIFDADTDNNEITVLESGTYGVSAFIRWRNDSEWSTGDELRMEIKINGSSEYFIEDRKVGTERQGQRLPSIPLELDANDTVDIRVQQDSGEPQEIETRFDQTARFGVWRAG